MNLRLWNLKPRPLAFTLYALSHLFLQGVHYFGVGMGL